jgi:ribonuclease HI
MTGFHILQWNSRSLFSNNSEFKKYIFDLQIKPGIICVQETFLKSKYTFSLPGYDIVRKDRIDKNGGGVAMFIKKGIPYSIISTLDNFEVIQVKVFLKQSFINIVNLYNPPGNNINYNDILNILNQPNLIFCADINAHNKLWGSKINSRTGLIVEDAINKLDLVVLNDGTGTHLKQDGQYSHLDVSICSSNLASKLNWQVLDVLLGSDHCVIKIDLDISPEDIPTLPNTLSYNYNKANWCKFAGDCDLFIDSIGTLNEPNVVNDKFTEIVINSANSNIPTKILGQYKRSPVPWWNSECDEAIKIRNLARNKVSKSRLPQDFIEYKKYQAKARYIIKLTKKLYWANFCSNLNSQSKPRVVWRTIKKMSSSKQNLSVPVLNYNNNLFIQDKDKANLFANQFAHVSSNINRDPEFEQYETFFNEKHKNNLKYNNDNSSPINVDFSYHELIFALSKCKNTTPGPDKISYVMLQHLSKKCLLYLLMLFNLIWNTGIVPCTWKHAIVIPILKIGKKKDDPTSYRPIALTSCLSKLLERMVSLRLQWYLNKYSILNNFQCGFRKGRCTLDHISRLSDCIMKAFVRHESVLAAFLDFEKAYDMVWHSGLLYKLNKINVKGNIFNYIKHFLYRRTFQVKINSVLSDIFCNANGTPQGSSISPILFLIMINDLPNISNSNVNMSLFADDCAIWQAGQNLAILEQGIQSILNGIQTWCKKWGMRLSVTKSVTMIFTKKRIYNFNLCIDGQSLPKVNEFKFLGVIFDKGLTWNKHIDYIIDRTKSRMNILRCLCNTSWGGNRVTMLQLYQSLIRSVIDYGCQVYDFSCVTLQKKLDSVQCNALRLCTGAMRSTPLNVLQADCFQMPFNLRRHFLQLKYGCKIFSSKNHPSASILEASPNDNAGNKPVVVLRSFSGVTKRDRILLHARVGQFLQSLSSSLFSPLLNNPIPYWLLIKPNVDLTLSNIINKRMSPLVIRQHSLEFIHGWSNYLSIYTDASKMGHKTGAAFFIPFFGIIKQFRLTDYISVFTAELFAIFSSLLWAIQSPAERIVIFSDSLSSLQALCNYLQPSHPIITEIINLVYQMINQGIDVHFAWVPAHCGLAGNEMVDKLAKQSCDLVHKICLPYSLKEVNSIIFTHIFKLWSDGWIASNKGKFYLKLFKQIPMKNELIYSLRNKDVVLARLRFGHCRLNEHLRYIGCHDTGVCSSCNVPETIDHFLLECTDHHLHRQSLIGETNRLKLQFDTISLLTNKSLSDSLYKYILLTKRMI